MAAAPVGGALQGQVPRPPGTDAQPPPGPYHDYDLTIYYYNIVTARYFALYFIDIAVSRFPLVHASCFSHLLNIVRTFDTT